MDRAARVHGHIVGLRMVHGYHVRRAKPSGATWRCHHGPLSIPRRHCLCRSLLHRLPAGKTAKETFLNDVTQLGGGVPTFGALGLSFRFNCNFSVTKRNGSQVSDVIYRQSPSLIFHLLLRDLFSCILQV